MINAKAVEVLLVEDLEEDAMLTTRSLRQNNLVNEVKWVEDGEEALDYLFCRGQYEGRVMDQQPKVILLDLKLPKINGLDVLKEIRGDARTRKIPVVIITSSKESKDVQSAYDAGANSYIVKPVNFKNFSTVVRDIGIYWLLTNQQPD